MARRKRKRIASRGSVNNIILKTLVNGDKYGYEIIKEVEEYSDGRILLKQPSLYSSLSRFEDKKFVTSYWGDSDIGGRRHYYHLTEEGLAYYKKAVLKEVDEEDSIDEYIDNSETNNNLDHAFEEDDESEDLSIEEDEESPDTDDSQQIIEISEDDIPAIANFDNEAEKVIIPDHAYYSPTPMDSMLLNQSDTSTSIQPIVDDSLNNIEKLSTTSTPDSEPTPAPSENSQPWKVLADSAKNSNKLFAKTKVSKLYLRKPKKVQKVILDKDGIYKLRDEDYIAPRQSSKPVIIDNVIKRTKDTNIYGYGSYTESTSINQSSNKPYSELSEDEKRQRNENFLAKFNLLTKSKMKPVSSPVIQKEEPKPEKQIDYRSKLNAIIESSSYEEEVIDEPVTNNLYNYEDTSSWNTSESMTLNNNSDVIEDEEDNFIDFEPQEFETKTDNSQYVDKISNYSTTINEIQLNRYEHRSQAVLVDKTYILINKLKFVFGIIMTLLMITELTIALFSFRNNDLFVSGDKTIFILSYSIVGIFGLIYILPFCFNSNEHKVNNFKFKYSFWFGILTFIVCSILIYCINALSGFELDNLEYFAVKLFVPMILCFNFIIGPVVYHLLNKSKSFYD